ncbi:hypothetical protein ACPCTO_08915 [Streptomyces olivoreticuli]
MRTLLRVLIDERNWQSYPTFRAQYEKAARELAELEGSPHLVSLTLGERTFERWYAGNVMPIPDARRVLVHLFGYPVEDLLGPALQDATTPAVLRPSRRAGAMFTDHRAVTGAEVHEMGRQVAMAANRALRFAVAAESNQIGPETLAHVTEEVRRIAGAYPRVPLNSILGDLIEVQDLTFRLLEDHRMRPGHARDLHLMAAMSSGMLAKAAHDLGDPQSAMRQARAAYVCADQADHPAMRAWTRGLQSLISYWAGRPTDAVGYAASGAATAPRTTGTVGVWLASLEARAHALLGDGESVHRANRHATDAREYVTGDDLDDIGGILTFPRPRQLYYTAEAEVLLGQPDTRTEEHAKAAVRAYRDAPPEEWAFGDEAGACTNLALARIVTGSLDGAADAVRPVLDLPPDQRNAGIIISTQRVHGALRTTPVRSSPQARQLRAEIELFTSTPVPALRL